MIEKTHVVSEDLYGEQYIILTWQVVKKILFIKSNKA